MASVIEIDTPASSCKNTTSNLFNLLLVMKKATLEDRIIERIKRSKDNVFLRKEFDGLGGYDQVGRVLRGLVKKGVLVKAGYGIYVKARVSSLTGNFIPVTTIHEIAMDALTKLGVNYEWGKSARKYNEGMTTQVPAFPALNIGNSRVTRKICFGYKTIKFEREGIVK